MLRVSLDDANFSDMKERKSAAKRPKGFRIFQPNESRTNSQFEVMKKVYDEAKIEERVVSKSALFDQSEWSSIQESLSTGRLGYLRDQFRSDQEKSLVVADLIRSKDQRRLIEKIMGQVKRGP